MALLIQNGRIVTSTDDFFADILCEGETISRIAPKIEPPANAKVIDAAGQFVFPGFIDPHVHICPSWERIKWTPYSVPRGGLFTMQFGRAARQAPHRPGAVAAAHPRTVFRSMIQKRAES